MENLVPLLKQEITDEKYCEDKAQKYYKVICESIIVLSWWEQYFQWVHFAAMFYVLLLPFTQVCKSYTCLNSCRKEPPWSPW